MAGPGRSRSDYPWLRESPHTSARHAYARRETELENKIVQGATRELERRLTISVIDHERPRQTIEDLLYVSGIHRVAGRDPLIAYQRDAADLFHGTKLDIKINRSP